MAIIIPSKHIYSKNFDPVIDNNISKTEVNTNKPQIINDTENVYNETVKSGFIDDNRLDNYNSKQYSNAVNYEQYPYSAAIAYIDCVPNYVTKTYHIPKQRGNSFVTKLFTKTDENGNANIKCSLSGNIEKGNLTAESTIVTPQGHPFNDSKKVEFNLNYNSIVKNIITAENNVSYNLDDIENLLKNDFRHQYPYNSDIYYTVSANITLPQKTDIFNAIACEYDNYYSITFSVLSGIVVRKLEGINKYSNPWGGKTVDFPLTGTYEEYIPTQIDISFYGNTIKLDLQDKTINIGNGNKTYSFEGNELIQTTNIPSIESKYQSVIDSWKNGKQTAVITCPIANYYDENGNKVIDTSVSGKMLFQEGDIVIPYTYTNQGDKPISYNKDFTPKQFTVIGTKISKKQGVTQELTLQEV